MAGGEPDFEQADAWLLVGNNPIISKSAGLPGQNPAQKLKEAQARGLQLIEAARVFAGARIRHANSGTGASFSMYCNLKDYLVACLNTVCGAYTREGERVTRPNAMLPAYTPRAQAFPPFKAWGFGEKLRVRGLTDTAAGMPTAALADEILLPGDGQVKALICIGGNPMAAWPDQRKTQRAMEALDLLVTLDVEMSTTARLAHYVIACTQTLETPGMSQSGEVIKYFGTGIGFPNAYAQYSPAVADVPHGSDLVDEWEFFYRMAVHLELDLVFVSAFGFSRYQEAAYEVLPLSREQKPDIEALYGAICAHSRIPLEEVKRYPHGHIFDSNVIVQPREPACEDRLECGNAVMMER